MIKIDNTFKLHNVQSNIIMKVDSQFNTLAVLGVINSRPTTEDREDPPKCGNGFQTADLPFAKGHVIALELGGSDVNDHPNEATHDRLNGAISNWPKSDSWSGFKL